MLFLMKMIQEKMEKMNARGKKDPVFFAKELEKQHLKEQKIATSLSPDEAEYFEFVNLMASSVSLCWPDIENRKQLLKNYIQNGSGI